LYCDDTSGNVSKKWNKHNSVLLTFAGLPRRKIQNLSNIHFLSTSNIAPPLEMMEYIIFTIQKGGEDGIPVWDCLLDEEILLVPWVLAFQGDNPMASEFASHIGMKGKYFCRICHAFGSDSSQRPPGHAGELQRLEDFLKPGVPRSKAETIRNLEAQLKRVLEGAPSAVNHMATETGTKDKYLQHFIDQLSEKCRKIKDDLKNSSRGERMSTDTEIASALQAMRHSLPANLFNPALMVDDFDPHADSPVELLHVVLLGVVKYWWRDAVSRQDSEGRKKLIARINSVDSGGLSIKPPEGHILVHYAGSLVGRDFRVILEMAPFILINMIPKRAYEAWLSLVRLAPLLYQPEISDIDKYMASSPVKRLRLAEAYQKNYRRTWRTPFSTSLHRRHFGIHNGSINQSSTSSFTFLFTSGVSALRSSMQPKDLNLTTQSSVSAVFIRTVTHQA
ncbi:hypothetical protein PUNSTDRAFT_76480, partial [Punctularia strigosozonata HHB-11173 SS5]